MILKAKGVNLQSVRLGGIQKLSVGEKVYVISSPKGLENTISEGILSGIREIDPKRKILQITAPVSPRSSGGPVFNNDGGVIGIVTSLIKEAQNLNFAMPVNLIKDKTTAKKIIALKDAELEDYKKSAEYWFYVGYCYGESGMYKEAIEDFKQAIGIKPDDADAHFFLCGAYLVLNDRVPALEQYKILKDLDPEKANELFNLIYK